MFWIVSIEFMVKMVQFFPSILLTSIRLSSTHSPARPEITYYSCIFKYANHTHPIVLEVANG